MTSISSPIANPILTRLPIAERSNNDICPVCQDEFQPEDDVYAHDTWHPTHKQCWIEWAETCKAKKICKCPGGCDQSVDITALAPVLNIINIAKVFFKNATIAGCGLASAATVNHIMQEIFAEVLGSIEIEQKTPRGIFVYDKISELLKEVYI